MTDEKKEKLGFTPDGWEKFIGELAVRFGDGRLISHEWLKEQFGLKELNLEEFASLEEFLKARDNQQFAYMTIVDAVRWELLEQEKMYIASVRGDGYKVIHPADQTRFGYEQFMNDIKKAVKEAGAIMNSVLPVDVRRQAEDNDLRAKFGMMKQLLENIK